MNLMNDKHFIIACSLLLLGLISFVIISMTGDDEEE